MSNRYENELVALLYELGYGVMRAAGSGGSGNERECPDVLVGQPGAEYLEVSNPKRTFSRAWAIEHKSGKDTTLYVEKEEVEALESFAEDFGATPFLVARFTSRSSPTGHFFVAPEHARGPTDGGRYGLPVDDVEDRAKMAFYPNAVGDDE